MQLPYDANAPADTDPTKRPWYVAIDLTIKLLSGVLLAGIAVIGTQVQSKLNVQHEQIKAIESRQRHFLPLLQTLAEVQLLTSAASGQLAYRNAGPTAAELDGTTALGTQFRYLAQDLRSYGGEVRIKVTVPPAFPYAFDRTEPFVTDLDTACLCFGETLLLVRQIETDQVKYATVRARVRGNTLELFDSKDVGHDMLPLQPRCVTYWRAWNGNNVWTGNYYAAADFAGVANALAESASGAARDLLQRYPSLAEPFVAVRMDVLKARDQIVPRWSDKH